MQPPLPAIEEKIRRRPGAGRKTKKPIYVPDEKKYPKFWRDWYAQLDASGYFSFPFEGAEAAIDPFFGYYGLRWQPTTQEPQSFHIGLDFIAPAKTTVGAVAAGMLEYSGFDIQNGNYILLSHPAVLIEGGGILRTLYMHMRANTVKFTSYQKMLREISLHTYPEVPIERESQIGEVGDSGNIKGTEPRLHMQIQVKTKAGKLVALDPARVLGILPEQNLTAQIDNREGFNALRQEQHDLVTSWRLDWAWQGQSLIQESDE